MTRKRIHELLVASTLLIAGNGCAQVLGLDSYKESGSGGASGTTSSSASPTTATSSTGASNSTGAGCMMGTTQACYSGDPATQKVGNCKDGVATCDGGQLSSCMGEVTPQTEDPYTVGDENCDGIPVGDLITAKNFDGDLSAILDMAVDAQGNLVIAGFFAPNVNFGPTPQDELIAQVEQDFFVAKFDPQGHYIWSQRFGNSTNEIFIHLAVADTGNIWLTGVYKSTITFGPSVLATTAGSANFVAELDPMGMPIKAVSFQPGSTGGALADIAALPGGDAVVAGTFDTAVDFGGGHSLAASGTAGYVARFAGTGLTTAWAVKYGDGDPTFGYVDGAQTINAVATDSGGNIGVVGTYTGSLGTQTGGDTNSDGGVDGFFVRLLANGQEATRAYAGGLGDVTLDGIASDPQGDFIVTGNFNGSLTLKDATQGLPATLTTSGPTDTDFLVWKLTGQAKQLWSKKFGDTTDQIGGGSFFTNTVATSPTGRILFSGGFFGSVDFGGKTITSVGDQDAFVTSLNADGSLIWTKSFGDGTPSQMVTACTFLDEHHVSVGLLNTGVMDLGGGPLTPTTGDASQFILASFFD